MNPRTIISLLAIPLAALLLLVAPATVLAQYGSGGDFDYSINPDNTNTITITGYTGPAGAVTFPTNINGLTVTGIGSVDYFTFSDDGLTSVTIGNGVTSIEAYAFNDCTTLTDVTVANSVTNIGEWAFNYCINLTNIIIGNGAANMGGEQFNDDTNLTSLIVGDGATNIVDSEFIGLTTLTSVTISNGVTIIGNGAFQRCSSLANVSIPNTVTSIGGYAFASTGLTNVNIPNSVTSIGYYAFSFCTSLASATIGNGLTSIGELAFNDCTSLTDLTIPNSVTNLGEYAINYCIGLTNITIGSGVTSIASYAFNYCSNLTAAYFTGNSPPSANIGYEPFDNDNDVTVYYLPGTTGWSSTFWGYPSSGPPAVLWNPLIQASGANFGVKNNQFGFNITGTNNFSVVVEACTNLANPVWTPLKTVTLTNGSYYFSEPFQPNPSSRFYGVGFP